MIIEPFEQWGIDFIGPINPPSRGKKHILVCIDYVSKWVEVMALTQTKEEKVANFLLNNIMQRFGALSFLVSDQIPQFMSKMIKQFVDHYQIKHKKASPYHPQTSGQVEVTNRELKNILTKIVASHKKDWADRLPKAVWAYNITWKSTTRFTPYELVYGKKPLLPIEFEIQTLRLAMKVGLNLTETQKERIL